MSSDERLSDDSRIPSYHDVATRLRRALHTEAEMVHPHGDGLDRIRERSRSARTWWRPAAAVGAGAAALVAVAGGGVLSLRHTGAETVTTARPAAAPVVPVVPVATPPRAGTPTAGPAGTAELDAPATPGGPARGVPAPATVASGAPAPARSPVDVFFVREDAGRPRLYRERRTVTPGEEAVGPAALMALFAGPSDPDHTSSWPAGTRVVRYERTGDLAAVELTGAEVPDALALQQLVHTVSAADPGVIRVAVSVDGRPTSPEPVARDTASGVLARVEVIDPGEDRSVARTFTAAGEASVPEGTVSWELRRGTEVVASGFATASTAAPGRGSWAADVTAPAPGRYVLHVFTESTETGRRLHEETRALSVR